MRLYTVTEAAERAGCTAQWIADLHRMGRLPAIRTAGKSGLKLFEEPVLERLRVELLASPWRRGRRTPPTD
jgi:DNA-binding transcriptional MerR regulator